MNSSFFYSSGVLKLFVSDINILLEKNQEINKELSNSNNNEFEYSNGQYIAIEGLTETTMNSVKIQGTVVNKKIEYGTGVNELDKIENVRFKFTDLGLEAVYNNAPVIKIDENIKLDGTERKNKSDAEEDSSGSISGWPGGSSIDHA